MTDKGKKQNGWSKRKDGKKEAMKENEGRKKQMEQRIENGKSKESKVT